LKKNRITAIAANLFLKFIVCGNLYPQTNIRENSFFYPHSLNNNEILQTLGLSTAKLPEDVVETDDVFRAPLFSYRIKYGLPENIIAEGSAETNIITFHFASGGKWNHEFGKFTLSSGGDIAFWLGRLKQFGFNTRYISLSNLSFGSFPFFSVSLNPNCSLYQSDNTTNEDECIFDTFSGYSFGLYVEQPLWKDNVVVIGFKSNFTKFYYPLWAFFQLSTGFLYIELFSASTYEEINVIYQSVSGYCLHATTS
jgi:hypothetical protein